MRGVSRRAKPISRFRHQRLSVDVPAEATDPEASVDGAEDDEKIEVHVHVHRVKTPGARPKRPPPRSVLTGTLFDWQGHYDLICKRPPRPPLSIWSALSTCQECGDRVGLVARRCIRCGAPRSLRVLSKVVAALGLGTVVVVFGLCAKLLGGSVAEYTPPQPVGEWSYEDVQIVEVQVAPSPFTYVQPPSTDPSTSGDQVATR